MELGSFFYHFATPLHASTLYVSDTSVDEFRLPYEMYHTHITFRKIHTYTNIFYFSIRVSSSHVGNPNQLGNLRPKLNCISWVSEIQTSRGT